jgi:hypothetical protein
MNIRCLVDFKDLHIELYACKGYIAQYKQKPIQIGEYKGKRFVKIQDTIIQIAEILYLGGILIVKLLKDGYYVIQINTEQYKSLKQLYRTRRNRSERNILTAETDIIKCEDLYKLACAIEDIIYYSIDYQFHWSVDNIKLIDRFCGCDYVNNLVYGIDKCNGEQVLDLKSKKFVMRTRGL